jgi:DNA-binding NtrC family response regulator
MANSLLDAKRILAVDDDPDVLTILEEEILNAVPGCHFNKAVDYQTATKRLVSFPYDLIILDVAFIRAFDLLNLASKQLLPVPVAMLIPTVMLRVHGLFSKTLRRVVKMGVRVFLPKEELSEIVPLLEGVFKHRYLPEGKSLFVNLRRCLHPREKETWQNLAKTA